MIIAVRARRVAQPIGKWIGRGDYGMIIGMSRDTDTNRWDAFSDRELREIDAGLSCLDSRERGVEQLALPEEVREEVSRRVRAARRESETES
jgi:hypothetical protein